MPRVPAVALGDRAVHGWNPAAYAALLGVAWQPPGRFPPAELAARLDAVLESAQALVARFDRRQLDVKPPERDRTIRDLAYHVFRLALAYVDAMEQGRLPETWFDERAPADFEDGGDVARYGALVRGRLTGWFQGAGADEFDRVVDVYYGPQSGHDLLERTTWHAGQHLRQLHVLAERAGVEPPGPLPAAALRGLPLPEAIW